MKKIHNSLFCIALIALMLSMFSITKAEWDILYQDNYEIEWYDLYADGEKIIAVGYIIEIVNNNFQGQSYILRSNDNGKTFDTTRIGDFFFLKAIDFPNKMDGVIGGFGQGAYTIWVHSDDFGQNWTYEIEQTTNGVADLSFLDEKIGFASGYGTGQLVDGFLQKTTDGGQSWEKVGSSVKGKTFDKLQFIDEMNGFTLSTFSPPGMLHKTTDGGENWATVLTDQGYLSDLHFFDKDNGIVVGGSAVYKTTDGGENWDNIHVNFSDVIMEGIDFVSDNEGYAVGTDTDFKGMILKTTDGGVSWTREDIPHILDLKDVRVHNGSMYAFGMGVVLRKDVQVSVNEEVFSGIKLYPNPSAEYIKIDGISNQSSFKLLDLSGRVVLSGNMKNKKINLKNVTDGFYLLQIKSEEKISTHKITVIK
jgi:photosystem II stability/assembly factor-like uncharacterized protein